MGRMKDLDMRLDALEGWHSSHSKAFKVLENKLDGLLHLMTDMASMEHQIKKMEENIERRLSRMEAAQGDSVKLVDRLIEMTLVQAGQPDQAVLHRAQSRLDQNNNFFSQKDERVEDDEDVWPPPGCDAMESRG